MDKQTLVIKLGGALIENDEALTALALALEQGAARTPGERWLHPSDRSKAQRGLALFLQHNPIPSA